MKQFIVNGMSCAACSSRVEEAVKAVPGVKSCSVSLLTNSLGVEGEVSDQAIIDAVVNAGYGCKVKGGSTSIYKEEEDALKDRETPKLKRRLQVSVGFLLVLMYFTMGYNMWGFAVPSFLDGNYMALTLLQLLLTIVVLVINRAFFINGFKALKHGTGNMDTLVALGSTASFLWSLYVFFKMTAINDPTELHMVYHTDLYFESAAMIPTLITIGKMLEASSKGKTTSALKGLLDLAPKNATLRRNGEEIVVPIEDVMVNDTFVVKPGEKIPLDGVVLTGESAVDESCLTGESVPVDKVENDEVYAGTINRFGALVCKVTKENEDTTLANIIELVSKASATKAPIARIADKVSGIFVPTVVSIAIVTIIIWLLKGQPLSFALARGISVLVISCPCALGLATPVAIMVSSGIGAKNGILFKTGAALEETGKMDYVCLDKTGTITTGVMEAVDIVPLTCSKEELLEFAYSVERNSEHPLASAIVNKAQEEKVTYREVEDFTSKIGNGVTCKLDGSLALAGKVGFIKDFVNVSDAVYETVEEMAKKGETPTVFAKDNEVIGLIGVADTIREESFEAIKQLRNMGIHVVMITGDNEVTAKAIGEKAGVDEIRAEVLPNEKEAIINEYMQLGKVCMVGDGINDAPALTRADIGIAIGSGTDVAIDAAEVVLMKSNLKDVPAAIRLSRRTLTNIHQNLFWAFFYNMICIPLAAGVTAWKMNPMIAAAAMSLSSVTVVSNALRLNGMKVYDASKDKKKKESKEVKTIHTTIGVKGMMCGHCEKAVTEALLKVDGIVNVNADHTNNEVTYCSTKMIPATTIQKVIEDAGYEYFDKNQEKENEEMEKVLHVEGMMCGHCEAAVEKAVGALEGVKSVKADHEKNLVTVTCCECVSDDLLKKTIEDKDYKVVE